MPGPFGLTKDKDGLTTYFDIVVAGVREMRFKSCEGLQSEIEVETLYHGGSLAAPFTVRGAPQVSKVTFGQGSAGGDGAGKNLFEWFQDVCNSAKPLEKKVLSITVKDAEENVLAEWTLKNAWPCRWVAPLMTKDQSSVAVQHISFAHEGIERKR